ncbi:MAG: protein kinase [Planctomycetota bacterium]|nr:protein kinase [Planctomycetota bacterium]
MADPSERIDEEARRRFESDWNSHLLTEIEDYLPDPSDEKYWPTLEELLYIDLEFFWKSNKKKTGDSTVPNHRSPNTRLRDIAIRLNFDQKPDLLNRLLEYGQSLAQKRNHGNVDGELDTVPFARSRTAPHKGLKNSNRIESNQDFGDYLLLDQLGRGGMGIVFEAVEKKTGRHVALKMIRANLVSRLDQESQRVALDRFQTEAKAVANIDHPNIVTLFQIAQYEETPFIAMQLVNGENLATKIKQSTLDGKTAAAYMKKVAEAIETTHAQGIVHRDLKPQNILLNRDTDEPLVTDFGLAKLVGENSEMTETGELLGTPGYMSPEQANGQTVGYETDIYSLGATLYCLLVGRPPFQAADTMKTVEQIVNHPPISPNEVNPDIDLDLTTICLKCLEKTPSRRYNSARELALDLDRYLKGEPIFARPIGRLEKSIRWCKRNPLPTTIFAALTLLIFVSMIGIAWTNYYANQTAFFSQKNKANSDLAFAANREELFLVAKDMSLKLPGMGETRRKLLVPLRDFFESYIALNGDYAEVITELAFSHSASGTISFELGKLSNAIGSLNQAIEIQSKITQTTPSNPRVLMDLSNSLNLRGQCLVKIEKREAALADFKEAYRLRKRLVSSDPQNIEFKRKLANAEMNLGNWYGYDGSKVFEQRAMDYYLASNQSRDQFLQKMTDNGRLVFRVRHDKAQCLFNIAIGQLNLGQPQNALLSANSAIAILRELHQAKPKFMAITRDMARCAQLLAELKEFDNQDPTPYLIEVAAAYEHINKIYPSETEYFWLAAKALVSLGDYSLREQKEISKSKHFFEQAYAKISHRETLNPDSKLVLIRTCVGMATIHMLNRELDAARKKIVLARKTLSSIQKTTHPDYPTTENQILQLEKILTL